MTNDEAITRLKGLYGNGYSEQEQALGMAIRALKNGQTDGDLVKENTDLVKEDAENADKKGISGETVSQRLVKDGDLISRTELLNKIWQKEYGKDYDGVNTLNIPHIDIIENMPSAENTAEWKPLDKEKEQYYMFWYICSKCGAPAKSPTKYCSNCGARMGVEQ